MGVGCRRVGGAVAGGHLRVELELALDHRVHPLIALIVPQSEVIRAIML